MSLEILFKSIEENEEIGRNEPVSEPLIMSANLELRRAGVVAMPREFWEVLKKYNGLSHEGNVIFGIGTGTEFFPDLVEVNTRLLQGEDAECVILGQDDDFYLIYDEQTKLYRIIDQTDFAEEVRTSDLAYAIAWILKI
ncbi:MAG: hypothetical protein IJ689_02110 [Alphaproteobacteria bacterium]|nr:hypothetical protein [Alphaproteobacteria bacterium]